jgi:hypothetical protein
VNCRRSQHRGCLPVEVNCTGSPCEITKARRPKTMRDDFEKGTSPPHRAEYRRDIQQLAHWVLRGLAPVARCGTGVHHRCESAMARLA